MSSHGTILFETPIGTCGLAWSGAGILAVQLPEIDAAATLARLKGRVGDAIPGEPSAEIADAIRSIQALLQGQRPSLGDVRLDEGGVPAFDRSVYGAARLVLPGDTSTYGRIAAEIGRPGEARAVGQALGRNPFPIVVPCHRILGAGGKVGGFSGAGGVATKLAMLTIERASTGGEPSLFDGTDWPLAARRR